MKWCEIYTIILLMNNSPESELIKDVVQYTHNPMGFVNYSYDWGEGVLRGIKGPRKWQKEVLQYISDRLEDPKTRHKPIKISVASGHGVGKSALMGMITTWGLATCEDAKIVITANTETQLRTKTSPEIQKWINLSIVKSWFKTTATAIFSTDRNHERSWRADFVPWSKTNTEAFAGLHNLKKRIILLMDEGSAIEDVVWEVAEGALTDENTEIIWIVFGNPTRATGRFRECFRNFKKWWKGWQVDAREVEGTNKEQQKEWEEQYGENSDFFKIRVRGVFPSQSVKQFISEDDVDAAFGKHLRPDQFNWAPKIIAVDPAWEGDDEFVISLRQGLAFKILRTLARNDNDIAMAQTIAQIEDEEKADAVFIDGGFGTGIVSAGRTWNRTWRIVWFNEKADDPGFVNKRAEMWKRCKDWLKEGGAIPADETLRQELISPETVPRVDGKIQLESKKDMKNRGIPSPNRADSLVITFAYNVKTKTQPRGQATNKLPDEYDPFATL